MKKTAFPLFTLMLIWGAWAFIPACRSIPKAQPGHDLVLATAFMQKEIPGQQNMKVKDYLTIQLKDYSQEQCVIDSVYYMNSKYSINNSQLVLKISLDTGLPAKNTAFVSLQTDLATLFYHKNSATHYLQIENIKRLEPLYLP